VLTAARDAGRPHRLGHAALAVALGDLAGSVRRQALRPFSLETFVFKAFMRMTADLACAEPIAALAERVRALLRAVLHPELDEWFAGFAAYGLEFLEADLCSLFAKMPGAAAFWDWAFRTDAPGPALTAFAGALLFLAIPQIADSRIPDLRPLSAPHAAVCRNAKVHDAVALAEH
jgi:hypothetical protein